MRLIDTRTHLLLEPWKAAGKEYAILSHTWGDQEVIFQEWEQLYPSGAIKGQCPHVRHQGIDKKAGYFKVMKACEQAQRDGFRYLWCDTMCINKESSAELSEAINSMFKWYRDAKVCYVYLTDVISQSRRTRSGDLTHSNVTGWFGDNMARQNADDVLEMKSRFKASRWWTRGWTLQELLAPKNVVFFAQDWTVLGHKSGMAQWISTLTRIHKEALKDHEIIQRFSIAQRMSWAADRQTTAPEDMAYCLLGIFDINMPMLYGQGESAFRKLQHEIIKASDDQSIFAWAAEDDVNSSWNGALAKSPRYFKNCGSIVRDTEYVQKPFALTNVGFKMRAPLIRNDFKAEYFLGLGCFLELRAEPHRDVSANESRRWIQIWIPVRKRGISGLYERIHSPMSHVYFQNPYPSYHKVIDTTEMFFADSPPPSSVSQERVVAGGNRVRRTGIAAAIGFGNMSIMSGAFKDVWHPREFRIIPIGSRESRRLSHEVIMSGNFCIVLSVAWDEHGQPRMVIHTTLHALDERSIRSLLDQLNQADDPTSCNENTSVVHQRIRTANSASFAAGQGSEAPLIIVEDEVLHDMYHMAYILVDVVFREKRT